MTGLDGDGTAWMSNHDQRDVMSCLITNGQLYKKSECKCNAYYFAE